MTVQPSNRSSSAPRRPAFAEDVYGGGGHRAATSSAAPSTSGVQKSTVVSTTTMSSIGLFSVSSFTGSSAAKPTVPPAPNAAQQQRPISRPPPHAAASTSAAASPQPVEMSQSSLAIRRSANLPKLKELVSEAKPSVDFYSKCEMSDIDFDYADADSYESELAELYSYSELEDFAAGLEEFNKYVDCRNTPQVWKSLSVKDKKRLLTDLVEMMESTNGHLRLQASRVLLYLLQGAFGDFKVENDEDDGSDVDMDHIKADLQTDKGTGGHEHDCLVSGGVNAYFAFEAGFYPVLCTMLLYEIQEPFDINLCAERSRSRLSSNSSRSASNVDLAESSSSERRAKRSATLADNEALRVVLSCLYHMLEAIRRQDWLEELAANSPFTLDALLLLQQRFLKELEQPLDFAKKPLINILFDMMPPFVRSHKPHFPMRKVLLLGWKVMLTTLGGMDRLSEEKAKRRLEAGLPVVEDTVRLASSMKAIKVNLDGDFIGNKFTGAKTRLHFVHPPRSFARQLACSNSKEEDGPGESSGPRSRTRNDALSEDDDDSLPMSESDVDDDVIEGDKKPDDAPTTSDLEDRQNPPPNGNADTPTVVKGPPSFAGQIPFQELHSRGDVTPKAGSPKKAVMPWTPKIRESQIEAFLQQAREKFLGYTLPPGDTGTTFGLPPPIAMSMQAFQRNLYKSLSEVQIANDVKYNKYFFTQREVVSDTPAERLYTRLLPMMSDYLFAMLKMILAALPSSKSRGDALTILSDVLTPETDNNDMLSNSINLDASTRNVLEEHVRVAIDIARHKEVVIKAISAILVLLFKWLKLNHIYQFESVGQHIIMLNSVPLMLKFLDHNMVRYVQAKNELPPFNYPAACLHFARNREEWPVLTPDNVDCSKGDAQSYFMWRNVFSSVNIVRLLNKVTKGRQPRTMMLVVFKSAPILKRCLRVKCGLFQLYCLKLIKLQCRFLGRQWRKSNMDLMTAIYMHVRHRINDDWAYANDTRNKQYDYQNEEKELKTAVERFHARRYAKLYPIFALEQSEELPDSLDYFDKNTLSDFEPTDTCIQSVLNFEPHLSDRFKRNYEQWLEQEVFTKHPVDWDRLLAGTKGIHEAVDPVVVPNN